MVHHRFSADIITSIYTVTALVGQRDRTFPLRATSPPLGLWITAMGLLFSAGVIIGSKQGDFNATLI